jgi:hypothetical protein
MHERRNQAEGKACDPEILPSYSAFGTYRIDPTSGVIRHQVDASLNLDASGKLSRTFAFEDGKLILGFTAIHDGACQKTGWSGTVFPNRPPT